MAPMGRTSNTYSFLTLFKNNTTYYFRISALNKDGAESELSNLVDVFVNIRQPGENMLVNGDFSHGDSSWTFAAHDEARAQGRVEDGQFVVDIESGGSDLERIQLAQQDIPLVQGERYRFES